MTNAKRIKKQIEKLFEDPGFFEQFESEAANCIFRIFEPYIRQVAQDALDRSAENAVVKEEYHRGRLLGSYVDKDSIRRTDIIIL